MFSRAFAWGTRVVPFLTTVLCLCGSAQAYKVLPSYYGTPTRWSSSEVKMRMAPELRDLLEDGAANRAFAIASEAWRGYPGVPSIVLVDEPAGEFDPDDHVNALHVVSPWPYDPDHIAYTLPRRTLEGEIISADVVINGDVSWGLLSEETESSEPKHDLAAILTHEFGHVLGLDESDVEGATMWPNTSLGDTHQRVLSEDDEDGVIFIYSTLLPADAVANCSVAPAGGRRADASWACLAMVAFGFIAVRSLRRARASACRWQAAPERVVRTATRGTVQAQSSREFAPGRAGTEPAQQPNHVHEETASHVVSF